MLLLLATLCLSQALWSQVYDTLRVATYNVLNYPGSTGPARNPEFRKVIHTMNPDLLAVQEMLSNSGLDQFFNEVMNFYTPGLYSAPPFNDGPDSDNSFFYRTGQWEYIGATYIPTALRDIAGYIVRPVNSVDTLRIYSLHLKASTGAANESLRLAEVTILRNHLNALPAGSRFLVVGDFNIYRSSEPAFQKLLGSESNNNGRCFDPLNLTGTFNTPSYAVYHTQSPRVRSFGGGATGGMDDRFDIILTSEEMQNWLIASSYTAYGNDGLHYNDSINRLPNLAVPDSVANALHDASDHIPVFASVVFERNLTSQEVTPGWNLISLPAKNGTAYRQGIYPTSTSLAFGFVGTSGYFATDTLQFGKGYWMKFPSQQQINVVGQMKEIDTLAVSTGWNLMGGISFPVAVSTITTVPPGIVTSDFFTYNNGYSAADTLQPGSGYWLKTSAPGNMILIRTP